MEWTPEKDAQLTEMHRKRLSVRFVADWMRWPPLPSVSAFLELGLNKPLTARASSVVARAAQPAESAPTPHRVAAPVLDDLDDDDEDLRARPGARAVISFPKPRSPPLQRSGRQLPLSHHAAGAAQAAPPPGRISSLARWRPASSKLPGAR